MKWNRKLKIGIIAEHSVSGASITIGTHILPLMLKQYQEIYPMLKITVIIKQSAAIEQLVFRE